MQTFIKTLIIKHTKAMKNSILSILCVIASCILFSSCDKDPVPGKDYTGDNTYIAGLEKMDSSHYDGHKTITDTYWNYFEQIPGFKKTGANEFILNGSSKSCNDKVLDACKKAEAALSIQDVGNYGFGVHVLSGTDYQKLYYHEF